MRKISTAFFLSLLMAVILAFQANATVFTGSISAPVGNGNSLTNIMQPAALARDRNPNGCDDYTRGYTAAGRYWNNTKDSKLYVLLDPGNTTTCTAIWDEVTNAAPLMCDAVSTTALKGCWGVSLMKQGYTGPIADVFRTSDNTSKTLYIASNTTTINVNDMLSFAQGSNLRVSKLYDQSGNSNDISQSTLANMPYLTTESGRPGLLFQGITQSSGNSSTWFTSSGTLAGNANAATLLWVGKLHNSDSGGYNGQSMSIFQLGAPSYLLHQRTVSRYGLALNPPLGTNHFTEIQEITSVNGLSLGGSAITVANDASQTLASTFGASAFTGIEFGNTTNDALSPLTASDVQGMVYYNAATSAANMQLAVISGYKQFNIVPQYDVCLHALGTSITAGQGAVSATNYIGELGKMVNANKCIYSWGSGGDNAQNWAGSTLHYVTDQLKPGVMNIVHIELGTNDLTLGVTNSPTQLVTSITTIVNAIRVSASAVGAPVKVVVGTILPRTVSGSNLANFAIANGLIRAGATAADCVADYAAHPFFSQLNSVTNTLVFVDAVHPSRPGQKAMAGVDYGCDRKWLP